MQRLAEHCLFSMALYIHWRPTASSFCRNMQEVRISLLCSGQNVIWAPSTCQSDMDAAVSIKTTELQSAIWPKPRLRVSLLDQSAIRESHHYVCCLLCVVGSHYHVACQVLLCSCLFLGPEFTLFAIFTPWLLVWCIPWLS